MRILGVIPARGGSKRIPRKNTQSVGGIPLFMNAALIARGTHLLDEFYVSTDDPEIAGMAMVTFGQVIHRPPSLAQDDTPMAPVLLHAAEATGGNWDAVVTIQPTSPLRTARDIDRAIAYWIQMAPGHTRESDDRTCLVSINSETGERNGAVYVTTMLHLKALGHVFCETPWGFSMPPERSLDINEPSDLEEARRLLGP